MIERIVRYFQCGCCKVRTRAEIRKGRHKLCESQNNLIEETASLTQPSTDEPIAADHDPTSGITSMQAHVRRHLAANRVQSLRREALVEVDTHWLAVYELIEEQKRLKALRELARKQFTLQYVSDVVGTAVLYCMQLSDAAIAVQRTWRGHWARKHLPVRRPSRVRKPRKYVPKQRFPIEVLRRVWARSEWSPQGGYLHDSDFGYLEYDIFQHADHPPEGRESVGLVTRKLHLPVRSAKDEFVVRHDRHSWVGLPVGFETIGEMKARNTTIRSASEKHLEEHSPFARPILSVAARQMLSNSMNKKQKSKIVSNLAEKDSTLMVLQSLGYEFQAESLFRLPGMPFIGKRMYDSETGHLLQYMGEGRWKRILTGELMQIRDRLFEERLDQANALESVVPTNGLYADDKDTSASHSTSSSSLLLLRPSVKTLRSGAIVVQNQNLEKASTYLERHAKKFEEHFGSNASRLETEGLSNSLFGDSESVTSSLSGWDAISRTLQAQSTQQGYPLRGGKKTAMLTAEHSVSSNYELQPKLAHKNQHSNWKVRDNRKSTWTQMRAELGDLISEGKSTTSITGWTGTENSPLKDMVDVWSRSLTIAKPSVRSLIADGRRKAETHYVFKYSWVPQPLLHNAVNNIYYERTYRDFRIDSKAKLSVDAHAEVLNQQPQIQAHRLQTELFNAVESTNTNEESSLLMPRTNNADAPTSVWDDASEDSAVFVPSLSSADTVMSSDRGVTHIIRSVAPAVQNISSLTQSPYHEQQQQHHHQQQQQQQWREWGSHALEMQSTPYDSRLSLNISSGVKESLFLTRVENPTVTATLRGSSQRTTVPTSRMFSDYVATQIPGELSRDPIALDSSSKELVNQGSIRRQKFRYRPPITVGAKIVPDVPTHAYQFR